MTPIRLGVIGAGLIWIREHQKALAALSETFVPVAFCEINAERRAALAAEYPNAVVTDSHEALLALPEVDAVLVLTPIALNAQIAAAALRAGKDTIMEKPIARSTAEAQTLLAIAQTSGKRLYVAEHMAYRPGEETIRAILDSGEIGDPVLWQCVRHWAVDPDPAQGSLRYDSTPWRKSAEFPLGVMFDGGIHTIAVLGNLFGHPSSVAASGRKLREGYGEFDQVATFMRYANGLAGMLSFSQWMPPMQSHFHIHGTRGILVVEPRKVTVQIHGQPDRVIALPEGDGRMAMWRAFARAFTEGAEPHYTPARAATDVALLEAVERAIKSGASAKC